MGSENELTPEQKLKGALIFKYLQTGKIPQRKGLFKTLFYLAGESKSFGSILMTSSSTTLKRPLIDRTIEIKVIINFPEQLPKIISNLEDIFKKESPSSFILVSPLGLVPNMEKVVELCDKYDVTLFEDVCESMGSKYNNKFLRISNNII